MGSFLLEEEDVAQAESGLADRLADGHYHVELDEIKQDPDHKNGGYTSFVFTVLAGTNAKMKNRTHREYCDWSNKSEYVKKKNMRTIILMAKLTGCYTPEELSAKGKSGDDSPLDWNRNPKKQRSHFVIEIETQRSKDKDGKEKVYEGKLKEMGIFAIDNPLVSHVPKDEHALAAAGILVAAADKAKTAELAEDEV